MTDGSSNAHTGKSLKSYIPQIASFFAREEGTCDCFADLTHFEYGVGIVNEHQTVLNLVEGTRWFQTLILNADLKDL